MVSPSTSATHWRRAGLNFLQYLSISTRALRNVLKEPHKGQALSRQHVFFNKTVGDVKTPITNSIPK